jgi:triphosphoribosyl-dephospho-CoA synthase
MLSIGLCAQTACIWEATARKAGNVHRYVDFADTHYVDFLLSAAAIAPILETASLRSLGESILAAVRATRSVAASNTNLGIILLLAPLASVPLDQDLRTGLTELLDSTTIEDARSLYEAIRLANPGGLGRSAEQDVQDAPTLALTATMQLAAARDAIARQYATGFRDVFDEGLPALLDGLDRTQSLEGGIIWCQLDWLARQPDTLLLRKQGLVEAEEASRRAGEVLAAGWPHTSESRQQFADFDAWLRAEGNRRNPGATADLVTACLFVALRTGKLTLPSRLPWDGGVQS